MKCGRGKVGRDSLRYPFIWNFCSKSFENSAGPLSRTKSLLVKDDRKKTADRKSQQLQQCNLRLQYVKIACIDVCHSSDFGVRRNVRLEIEGCMDTKTNYVNVNL